MICVLLQRYPGNHDAIWGSDIRESSRYKSAQGMDGIDGVARGDAVVGKECIALN